MAVADHVQPIDATEVCCKEIHHRVKNNLQIISSLLMLQVDQMPTTRAKELLEESVHRVRSMALIHQQLYGALSLERIDFLTDARQLTESLRGALAPSSRLRVMGDGVEMTVEHAVPLGLVLNELVTNALKYGLNTNPDLSREADVVVELHTGAVEMELSVRDFGPGLPAGLDVTKVSSLGLQLVRSLTKQLHGRLEVKSDSGAVFRLTCPRTTMNLSTTPRPVSA